MVQNSIQIDWGNETEPEATPVTTEGAEDPSTLAGFRPYILQSVFVAMLLAFPIMTFFALTMLKAGKEAFEQIIALKGRSQSLLKPAQTIKNNNREIAAIDTELVELKSFRKNQAREIATNISVEYMGGLRYGQRLLNTRKLYANDEDACERALKGEFGKSMAERHLFTLDSPTLENMLEKCLPLADYKRIEAIVSNTLH